MLLMERAYSTTEEMAPGLIDGLTAVGLASLEAESRQGIEMFRRRGQTGLLVPKDLGGAGACARQAVQYMLAIGSLAPSLSIVATMHHFSVASLAKFQNGFDDLQKVLLTSVVTDRLLVASAFAEARPTAGMFEPTMIAVRDGDNWIVNGSKKPCTLAMSMDLLTASVVLTDEVDDYAIMVIPARLPGISTRPFWRAPVLQAAESDEVVFENVVVPDDCIMRLDIDPRTGIDEIQKNGLIWFTILAAASYLGMVTALVQRVHESGRADDCMLGHFFVELSAPTSMLECVARTIDDDGHDADSTLAACLAMRFGVADAISRIVPRALEVLGGIAFIADESVGLLAGSASALLFQPPTRHSIISELGGYSAGSTMRFS
ncbi:acyl-CoA dehydrogenase family protein [Mycobacterium sp. 852002-40037_SCH5390672]|uniref:acyl-CoA dehydrogenase family protein n=1 Tax=Mycobacterium sp. 852002-40037_SCH5390672 TaxID=1834089 RepID=UPI000804AA2F|nr:acyl-CoA dehydrogenase family protein [Mycobacterium sp. 852002-40037_SCH5390672]OBB99593.1 hypothetical protein A5782_21755 [Mycobacterium sp. 852002-40037_SCH5390672]